MLRHKICTLLTALILATAILGCQTPITPPAATTTPPPTNSPTPLPQPVVKSLTPTATPTAPITPTPKKPFFADRDKTHHFTLSEQGTPVFSDLWLTLQPDGSAHLEALPTDLAALPLKMTGQWFITDQLLTVKLQSQILKGVNDQFIFRRDGNRLVVNSYEGRSFVADALKLEPANEGGNIILQALYHRLAQSPELEFSAPAAGEIVYDETVIAAVTAFQTSRGLAPSGVVDDKTWLALAQPAPQIPVTKTTQTPTPLPLPTANIAAAPLTIQAPLRVPDIETLPAVEPGSLLYLTFDDGPHPTYTAQILDLLAEYDLKASFFVIGRQVSWYPDLTRRIVTEGHYVGLHTYNHVILTGLTRDEFIDEVQLTEDAIIIAAGDLLNLDHRVRYLRPPYAKTDEEIKTLAAALNFPISLWNIDSLDWSSPDAETIAANILWAAKPNGIILMHDGGGIRQKTLDALKIALPILIEQGYSFKTLSE